MPLAIPDVTLLTASSNSMTDYMSALRTHFTSTSTKFSVKANTPTDNGFTLVPADVNEEWELNIRRLDTSTANLLIDPLENVTAPGNTSTPPTLTSSAESSGEKTAWQIAGGGSEDVRFYVIELDDAIFVLHVDSGNTFTPRCWHAGRTWIPFFTDGVNGDYYADGLGIHGYVPVVTSFSDATYFLCANAGANPTVIRVAQTIWTPLGELIEPAIGRVNGIERLRPMKLTAKDTDGTSDADVGWSKYILYRRVAATPGSVLDGGVGKDAWVSVWNSDFNELVVIPWDRNVTPIF